MTRTETPMTELMEMLRTMRPAGSPEERAWCQRWLLSIPGTREDIRGNIWLTIGDDPVIWSSHTDTVHKVGGKQVVYENEGIISAGWNQASCLGADCTAGAWLMRRLALAGKEGTYIWHYGEELGCVGSGWIAERLGASLGQSIRYAIAFDRRGTQSIITHQMGQRGCSDVFALALADGLGMGHRLDDGGAFTDTASYMDAIQECTNVSVGYLDEHGPRETLDSQYLLRLLDAVLDLDVMALPVHRDPTVTETLWDDVPMRRGSQLPGGWSTWNDDEDSIALDTLADVVAEYPDEVADWLEQQGVTVADVLQYIGQLYGQRVN